jgi:hypothetical protein
VLKNLGDLKTTETKKSVHVRIDVSGSPLEPPGAYLSNSCARSNGCAVICSRYLAGHFIIFVVWW